MKAARLRANVTGLAIEDIPEPVLRPGSVVVRVEAAFVSEFISRLPRNDAAFLTPKRPFSPGIDAVGSVEEKLIGDGQFNLSRFGSETFSLARAKAARPANAQRANSLIHVAIARGLEEARERMNSAQRAHTKVLAQSGADDGSPLALNAPADATQGILVKTALQAFC